MTGACAVLIPSPSGCRLPPVVPRVGRAPRWFCVPFLGDWALVGRVGCVAVYRRVESA